MGSRIHPQFREHTIRVLLHIGVVIPTYNEAENLSGLISALWALPLNLSVMVVDDNSPDGTGIIADQLAASGSGRVSVIHRSQKLGIASAYMEGFRDFIEGRVDAVAQMDADGSHAPAELPAMVKRLENVDLVLGSRFTTGGSVDPRWPVQRKALSLWGNLYARSILKLPYRDVTTGYRLWRRQSLLDIPWNRIQSNGYVFQIEMIYLAHCLKCKICEVPIQFTERRKGKSKMSFQIQLEATLRVWQMLLAYQDLHRARQTTQIKHMV